MAMKSLQEIRALYKEPQLLHRWVVEVPIWPSAVSPSNPNIMFMITTSALPENEMEFQKVNLGGFTFNYMGKEDRNGSIAWSFYENTDSDVLNYFYIDYANALQNFSSNADIDLSAATNAGLVTPMVVLTLLAADGVTRTKQYQLLNCFFNKGSTGDLGQEAEVMKPGVTVLYDSWVLVTG
jgi:hypothetical protein